MPLLPALAVRLTPGLSERLALGVPLPLAVEAIDDARLRRLVMRIAECALLTGDVVAVVVDNGAGDGDGDRDLERDPLDALECLGGRPGRSAPLLRVVRSTVWTRLAAATATVRAWADAGRRMVRVLLEVVT